MRVAVFGLGYVGSVTAACLAQMGHTVVGVDVSPSKVAQINAGQSPIAERPMPELVEAAVRGLRLRATDSAEEAIADADISLICVGTPSLPNGDVDLRQLDRVCHEVGGALRTTLHYHVVAVRSTVPPGVVESRVVPALEAASGRHVGTEIGVCSNPEFLREGSVVEGFLHPPFTLIGEMDPRAGDVLAELYREIGCPVFRTSPATALMVKYASNVYHALKISFANEIGTLCQRLNVDSHQVMDIFCADTQLNISRAYLRPGYAYGGSCLPKDLRAMVFLARHQDLDLPVLEAIARSNARQARRGIEMVLATGKKRVGVLGLTFKDGTDDLRESPLVPLVETLLGKGYDVRVYDPNIALARLIGTNRQYIESVIPHISRLLCQSLDEVLAESEVLVIGHRVEALEPLLAADNGQHIVVDLAGLRGRLRSLNGRYQGIAW